MVDKTPMLNGLSIKQRAKQYDAKKSTDKTVSGITKRAANYTGKKIAEQEESQKGPTMTKRGQYTFTKKQDDHPYISNVQFFLRLGQYIISCARISNLSMVQEVEEVQEGGNNDAPLLFFAPSKKTEVLTVERAMIQDEMTKQLKVGVGIKQGEVVIVHGDYEFRNLFFSNAIITKCEYGNLDAMGREVLLEKLEIKHGGFTLEE